MKRRDFLQFNYGNTAVAAPELAPRQLNTGLTPYNGVWGLEQAVHLLKRATFGGQKTQVDAILALGSADAAVTELMSVNNRVMTPAPPVNTYSHRYADPVAAAGQTFINAPALNTAEYYRSISLRGWWLGFMHTQALTVQEKMVYFWHNHIPVEFNAVFNTMANYRYLDDIRQNALGSFRQLIKDITLNPAMLSYLNGQYNNVFNPDENYARELQELFCIGKDGGAPYAESDVQAAARLLTGWRVNASDYTVYFQENFHDANPKQFSAFYNNTLIPGISGASGGEQELDLLLDMLLATDRCAEYLCRKLYRYFVYHEIDAQTEADVILPLAQVLRGSNYDIGLTVETLLKSEHFFDAQNRGAVLKSPLDFMMGMMRETGMTFPSATSQANDNFDINEAFLGFISGLQQFVGDPPNVSGYPAWYQEPTYDKSWITTDSLPRRAHFSDAMIFTGFSTNNFTMKIDVLALTANYNNPSDPYALIDDALNYAYCIGVSQAVKNYLMAVLLSGQSNTSYWTTAWDAYTADPTNAANRNVVETRLKVFYRYILQLEEYQLM